jgi:predicted GNAT family acetyltransferase
MNDNRFAVEDRTAESRYVLLDRGESAGGPGGSVGTDDPGAADGSASEIGEESYLDVTGDGATERIMYHTAVDEAYGGQGLASVLVRFAVEHTISAGMKVVPVCPYVAAWVKKHPEYAEHIVEATPNHLAALRAG